MANFIVKHRILILIVFTLAFLAAGAAFFGVEINYDMAEYLDEDMPSVKGLHKTADEFGMPTTMRVMVENVSVVEAIEIKNKIKETPYVQSITWLDDVADMYVPLEMMDPRLVEGFYKDGAAIFTVYLDYFDYSEETGIAVNAIKDIIGEDGYIFGPASSAQEVVSSTESSVGQIIFFFLPVVFVVLVLATNSFMEVILFFICLGYAIVLNAGTNIIFGKVSFVTHSVSTAIQLAISMDYSIFLLHRFAEEKDKGLEPMDAMKTALRASYSTIQASAITTIAGFVSLLFMNFAIGTDMGLVFGKGIILSFLCSVVLLPAITVMSSKAIDKTRHRKLLPSFKLLGKLIYKLRYVSIILLIIVIVPAAIAAETKTSYIYGGSGIAEQEGTATYISKKRIEDRFGRFNPLVLLVPKGDKSSLEAFSHELDEYEHVASVQSLPLLVDPKLPEELLPDAVKDQFVSENNYRIIVGLNTPEEGPETFEAVRWIHERGNHYYGKDYYITGISSTLYDVRAISGRDNTIVTVLSVVAVALVVLFTFRRLIIPILLLLCIQGAVWVNMSVPYFVDLPLSFIGKLVVSALMLGATIDYAILMTSRYIERREKFDRKESCIGAVMDSTGSIVTSATALTFSGVIIHSVSKVQTISEMGELIGRGAVLSLVIVVLALPAILYVFDRTFIRKKQAIKITETAGTASESSQTETESPKEPEKN